MVHAGARAGLMLDNLFGGWRVWRRWRGGTWARYHILLPHYSIDYSYWSRHEPAAELAGYLTVLSVERWDG